MMRRPESAALILVGWLIAASALEGLPQADAIRWPGKRQPGVNWRVRGPDRQAADQWLSVHTSQAACRQSERDRKVPQQDWAGRTALPWLPSYLAIGLL